MASAYKQVPGRLETNRDQNGVIQPLLTDLYQITMAYAYWKCGKKDDIAVFDLFFRKNPFHGEFTIFAGLDECLKFLKTFRYSQTDIEYLKGVLSPTTEPEFFDYLLDISPKDIILYSIEEGTVVFPKVPLIWIEGPLPMAQLLETTLLTLVNYSSLVATNAARFRMAAGPEKSLLEFGLRRAQGPDGGLSASRYCYIGGFDGTSNVLAGKLFNIPVKGTHAHAYVTAFQSLGELKERHLRRKGTEESVDFIEIVKSWLHKLTNALGILQQETSEGELAAFASYALSFPDGFLALVDTYDVLKSGIPNFSAVALALNELGYRSVGVRLDSGDLAYLSMEVRRTFKQIASTFDVPWFTDQTIVASNDINEDTIHSLNSQGHSINAFGIGTHLVTCQRQPALGCVYKLVEVNKKPRIKLSEDVEKVTIPGGKALYRLYGSDGHALVDLIQRLEEAPPTVGRRVLCRHPFQEAKRAYVSPAKVESLYKIYWRDGEICQPLPTLEGVKQKAQQSLANIRQDHRRALNPTPYKVSVSDQLYNFMHELWLSNAPIGELS